MDLDAVLARRPTIALVDELAHTNAPGSRNPKRYQDVEEILRAGISVITTLNIQHLESLHDIVERATGVRVKERIPDYVVTMADQIVNVDLSAEDLRERLQAGKIYPPERIQTAMENFFTPEKLTQLRELAMEEIAFRLDRHRARRAAAERRDGLGLGTGHGLPEFAKPACRRHCCARPPGSPTAWAPPGTPSTCRRRAKSPENIDAATQREIGNNLDLARQLGGTSLAFKGADLVEHDRRLRQGIRHHAHRPGPQPAALVSPLVRPVRPRSPAASHSRRGRDRGRQQSVPTV